MNGWSMSKYSVIVPVYKVEAVLPRCIESILSQTVTDFELILVDDGSPDRSGVICDEYAARDARIRVIHQQNAGVSAARNAGIRAAQGEYIVFVDGDDFVEPDILKYLSGSDADLVMVGFSDYANNHITKILLDEHEKWELSSTDGIQKYLKKCGTVFVWAKQYRKSIIDSNQICFREDMKYSEDIIFNNAYLLCARTAESIPWAGYYHCQYDNPTLSATPLKVPFTERNVWRRRAYEQFSAYQDIQKIYVSQTLYFAEQEYIKIANGKNSFIDKCKLIDGINSDKFFRKCCEEMPNAISRDLRILISLGLSALIVLKYRKRA